MTPADRVIYRVFIYDAPYSGLQGERNIAWTAKRCGVSYERVRDAIEAFNPEYREFRKHVDALRQEQAT